MDRTFIRRCCASSFSTGLYVVMVKNPIRNRLKNISAMKAKSETGSRLLDNTSILFGSNLGNANAHDTDNLPIFLAGGGFKHSGYVGHKKGESTPLSNLFLTLLNHSGIQAESFGPSTGTFDW